MSSATHVARSLEERALNAWPGLQQCLYDGWILRFSGGYTKRANSVIPFYAGCEPPGRKIRYCEEAYSRRGLPSIFKILPFGDCARLDGYLASLGYDCRDETSTQAVELTGRGPASAAAAYPVRVISGADPADLDGYADLNGINRQQHTMLRAILKQCVGEIGCVTAMDGDQLVGCGLGIIEAGDLGLYGVATTPAHRNRGIGSGVVASLLSWGQSRGATRAYLQVLARNAPARKLYARLGFCEIYRYWYRVPGARQV